MWPWVVVVVLTVAAVLAHVAWGAVAARVTSSTRKRRLRKRVLLRAEAISELVGVIEGAEGDLPGCLQEVLKEVGSGWTLSHGPYILAARRVATEFRALRTRWPNPKTDGVAVVSELRRMLEKRRCRAKDMVRILPLATYFAFQKSFYEQVVDAAFNTPESRARYAVSQEVQGKPGWFERMAGIEDPGIEISPGK